MLKEANLVRIRQTSRKLGERDNKRKKDALRMPDIGLIYHSLFQLLLGFGPHACRIARVPHQQVGAESVVSLIDSALVKR